MATEALGYGRIFRIWLMFLPYVVLVEPEDIQVVLSSIKHTRKIWFYKLLNNFIGKGLISLGVNKWRLHRKILQPAFHLHVLKRFAGTFNECADHLVDKLLEKDAQDLNLTVFINNSVYDILKGNTLFILFLFVQSETFNPNFELVLSTFSREVFFICNQNARLRSSVSQLPATNRICLSRECN